MKLFTHALFGHCRGFREPGRVPVRLKEPDLEACCSCGDQAQSGIYVRRDPSLLACQGVHEKEEA